MNREVRKIAQELHSLFKKAPNDVAVKQIMTSFIKNVGHMGNINQAQAVINALQELFDRDEGILHATITSAIPLTAHEKNTLIHNIQEKRAVSSVKLTEKIQPSVLGGITVQIDDIRYNATIRKSLHTLTNTLMK